MAPTASPEATGTTPTFPIKAKLEFLTRKRGYSLLEMMVVLALMALATALIVPRAVGQLDQVVDHSVFFDFQRQVSDLRRRAFRTETPLTLVSSAAAGVSDAEAPETVRLPLREDWSYALSKSMPIDTGGACGKVSVDLMHAGKVRVHLVARDGACHFDRLW